MMEVMRILKTLNLPLDRTVRIGLWSGEEQGLYGSRAYVKAHYADVKTGEVKPEQAKFDIYLNLDNGSGKIRGVHLEGNDAIRPLFESYLAPFRDMDVTTFSEKPTGGTDHQSFDDAGLPAFQFIQDWLDYSLTHHSDTDTYSHAVPEDLMQGSAVIATLVWPIFRIEKRWRQERWRYATGNWVFKGYLKNTALCSPAGNTTELNFSPAFGSANFAPSTSTLDTAVPNTASARLLLT